MRKKRTTGRKITIKKPSWTPPKKEVDVERKDKRKEVSTKQEEKDEQTFFTEQLKEQEDERKHTMAANETKHESKPVVGYSGSRHEGKKFERPKDASKEAVVSDAGVTEPTVEFGGDGITPLAEWDEKQKERREKQAEHDEKRRKQAVEDSGVIQTTEKHKNG